MIRKLYNALWGFRGKVFHIYYSMYRQNKALHMRFNDLEDRIDTAEHIIIENIKYIECCAAKRTKNILNTAEAIGKMPDMCKTPKKRKPGRPKKNH